MIDRTCLLFFPGTRPELAAKAVASGAGRVCVDLEDSVPPGAKAEARAAALELLRGHDGPAGLVVRVNHPSTPDGRSDVEAIGRLDLPEGRRTVMIPKAESPSDVSGVRDALGGDADGPAMIPVVETARGLARVEAIAASDGVSAVLFGGLDLSLDLDCALAWEPLLYARGRCVLAARLAAVDLIDTPYFDLDDLEGLEAEAARARRMGFTAKAAIHPSQVEVIRRAFAPSREEVARAQRVLEAHDLRGPGVIALDGRMIDRPAVEAARRTLARSASHATPEADEGPRAPTPTEDSGDA